ncbi:hypothetical protein GGR92_002960 [Spirosoma lacussanchae]|uniref:hypothetical protein n=1 Tax=Spirosoma lacussanchae TaxID=1884249 RepID=UPI00110907EC|nr:hypothetical protein [Spirosoma lacussanchae]
MITALWKLIVTTRALGWALWLAALQGLLCSGLKAQPVSQQQLAGIWIGVHSEWDTDFFCPLPTYLQLDTDGTYALGLVDASAAPIRSTWAVRDDSVRLDTIRYAPGLVRVVDQQLRIGQYYPLVFRKFTDIPLDSARTVQTVAGRVWQSDGLIIALYANGRVALEDLTTRQRSVHFWQLVRFGSSVFLVIQGNQYGRDGGYKPLWQLTQASSQQLQAIGWNGRTVATETFRFVSALAPGDSCRPAVFQPCDNCFTRMWHITQTGRTAVGHSLWQALKKHYQVRTQPGQSGLVRIQFVINCAGEQGLFEVAGFDEDYCPRTFDCTITDQLLALCRQHLPSDMLSYATDQIDTSPRDAAISLTFRLKDGQLTDMLP